MIADSKRNTSSFEPMLTSIVLQCQDILFPVLTKMINMSLDSGVFPAEWKVADADRICLAGVYKLAFVA